MTRRIIASASVAALALSLTACTPLDSFVGAWDASGQMIVAFQTSYGQVSDSAQLSGTVVIAEGISSDLVVLMEGCEIPLNVDMETAALASSYTCTSQSGGVSMALTFNKATLSVTENLANFSASGIVTAVVDGQTIPGTFTVMQSLSRISK